MEDVDGQPLGNLPGPSRIGVSGDTFIDDTGGGQGQWSVNNVGVTGDPTDVRHAPVHVLGMDVLNVLGRARHIGQVSAGTVLASLGFPGAAARSEERRVGKECRSRW